MMSTGLMGLISLLLFVNPRIQNSFYEFGAKYVSYFVTFTAERENNHVLLSWEIERDSTSAYFIVEKRSKTNLFEIIGVVRAGSGVFQYQFTDDVSDKTPVFYRIRSIKKQGESIYSGIRTIPSVGGLTTRFYPNPASNVLIFNTDMPVNVQIIDESGNLKIEKMLNMGLQIINISSLKKGNYLLKTTEKNYGEFQVKKLIKN